MCEKPAYIQEGFFFFYIIGGLYDAIPQIVRFLACPIACPIACPNACSSDCLLAHLI